MDLTCDALGRLVGQTVRRMPESYQNLIVSLHTQLIVEDLECPDLAAYARCHEGRWQIVISKALSGWPEAVGAYLMAHELAHLVLLHEAFFSYNLERYTDEEIEFIRRVFENHADFFVIDICGLEAEAREAAKYLGPSNMQLYRRFCQTPDVGP